MVVLASFIRQYFYSVNTVILLYSFRTSSLLFHITCDLLAK